MSNTRGFWIGLGVALAIVAFGVAIYASDGTQRECIKQRGNWDGSTCTWSKK